MSSITDKPITHEKEQPESERRTTASYMVGFILSLICTFIPYYMVTEQVVTGNSLLATIIAFAVVQMIIQLMFFLHLGREKKPRWNLIFLFMTAVVIVVVVGASLWIMHHLHYNMTPVTREDASKKLIEDEGIYQLGGEKTGACRGQHANHKVTIKNSQVTPQVTEAKVCDTLTFINEDGKTREMTFGTHPNHGVYAGESEVSVSNRRPESIVLSEPGTYRFHDHMDPKAAGSFVVTPQQ